MPEETETELINVGAKEAYADRAALGRRFPQVYKISLIGFIANS
jgi:hypothetical protein